MFVIEIVAKSRSGFSKRDFTRARRLGSMRSMSADDKEKYAVSEPETNADTINAIIATTIATSADSAGGANVMKFSALSIAQPIKFKLLG